MAEVLFLTQVLPHPLDAGPKVRAYHMLRHLAERHRVTLVAFTRADDPPESVAHLRSVAHAVYTAPIRRSPGRNVFAGVRGLATGLPIVIARDDSVEMRRLLRRLVGETAFDVVHADQLSMAWWGMYAAGEQERILRLRSAPLRMQEEEGAPLRMLDDKTRPATLLDEHNAIYLLVERIARTERNPLRRVVATREARAFARYERRACEAYDAVLTVTEEDRERLAALTGAGSREGYTVVPICVDAGTPAIARRPREPGEAPTILHLGTMFWPPNVQGVLWFSREVLPLVWREAPEARFVIAGKNPPAEVTALTADPRIEVLGYVADATPAIAGADAFVVPLHAGGGMRVKILDGWLWGLPLVSTTIGAEGIAYRAEGPEANIAIADTAEEFSRATLRVLRDVEYNQRLRQNGRAWVEQRYSYQAVYPLVDQVYTRLVKAA